MPFAIRHMFGTWYEIEDVGWVDLAAVKHVSKVYMNPTWWKVCLWGDNFGSSNTFDIMYSNSDREVLETKAKLFMQNLYKALKEVHGAQQNTNSICVQSNPVIEPPNPNIEIT